MEVAPRYTLFTLLTLGSFLLVGRMDGTDHTPYTVTTPRALVVLTIHSFTRVIQDMTFAPFDPSISDI